MIEDMLLTKNVNVIGKRLKLGVEDKYEFNFYLNQNSEDDEEEKPDIHIYARVPDESETDQTIEINS